MRLFVLLLALQATVEAAPTRAETDAARAAFHRGIKHYNLGEYEAALKKFKDAYLSVSDPSLLFNIAQCQRQLGLKQDAVRSYKNYLRESPNAPNRAEVERLIASVESSLREEEAARAHLPVGVIPEPSPAPIAVTAPPPAAPPPRDSTPVYKRWWLWTVVGVVAVTGVAVGLGVGLAPTTTTWPNADTPGGRIRF